MEEEKENNAREEKDVNEEEETKLREKYENGEKINVTWKKIEVK